MSRRMTGHRLAGNRADLLSALANRSRNWAPVEGKGTAARKWQRLETPSPSPSSSSTATVPARPLLIKATTARTARTARTEVPEIRLPSRSYATEHARSLEAARTRRLADLMALLNNVDLVARQLRDEGDAAAAAAADPAALRARIDAFVATREQTVATWRRQAAQRHRRRHPLVDDDPDTAMVHPAHVPGRRMGPAENAQQWKELDRLVQEQAATFEVVPSAPAPAPSTFSGAVRQQQQWQQQQHHHHHHHHHQTRPFSTASRPMPRPRSVPLVSLPRVSLSTKATTAAAATTTSSRRRVKTATTKPAGKAPGKAKSKKNAGDGHAGPPPPPPPPPPPAWLVQKRALSTKFGAAGWAPRRKLSPDAMLHLRALHASNPGLYTTPLLASTFRQSPEAIRRILRSRWLSEAGADAVQARRERWARRHDRIWDVKSELGLRPRRTADRPVDDASRAADRVETQLWADQVLANARGQDDGKGGGDSV